MDKHCALAICTFCTRNQSSGPPIVARRHRAWLGTKSGHESNVLATSLLPPVAVEVVAVQRLSALCLASFGRHPGRTPAELDGCDWDAGAIGVINLAGAASP